MKHLLIVANSNGYPIVLQVVLYITTDLVPSDLDSYINLSVDPNGGRELENTINGGSFKLLYNNRY